MPRKTIISLLAITVIALPSGRAFAERMPEAPKDATHVVSGVVQSVFVRETREQIQYLVEIKVSNAERPRSMKPGDVLPIYCFQARDVELDRSANKQEKALAALNKFRESGHLAVPREGQQIRVHAKPRNGRLEGLYPDWFALSEKAPQPVTNESVESEGDKISKEPSSDPQLHDDSEHVTAEESERYYFELMKKTSGFRIEKEDAAEYLHGAWRLDRKAHMSGGHYTRADQGDDVSMICTDKQLIQLDFNRNKPASTEYVASISNLQQDERGRLSFDKRRLYVPLSDTHLMVGAYDYVVVLRRVSAREQQH